MFTTFHRGLAVLTGAAVVVGLQASGASAAAPEAYTCTGTHAGGELGTVTIPKGASCTLINTTVKGSVLISGGGNSLTLDNTKVTGGVRTVDWNTNGSTVTITATSARVAGVVDIENAHSTWTKSRLGGLTTGGFLGDKTTLTRTRVTGDVVSGGRWTDIVITSSTIDGGYSGSWATTKVTSSRIKGKSTLSGYGITVCGSHLGTTELYGMGHAVLGDGDTCRGNTFEDDLTVTDSGRIGKFYNNTVVGKATSPASQADAYEGSGNDFQGGVTGFLAGLK